MVHQQMLENEDDEIKNNFKKLITATSRQEGSRPIADFHSKGDGRK